VLFSSLFELEDFFIRVIGVVEAFLVIFSLLGTWFIGVFII